MFLLTDTSLDPAWIGPVFHGGDGSALNRDPKNSDGHYSDTQKPIEQWIVDAQQGSDEAFRRLMEVSQAYLFTIARLAISDLLQSKIDPADLLQDTALAAYQSLQTFQGKDQREWLAWLRRILLRQASNARRRYRMTRKRDIRRELSLDGHEYLSDQLADRLAGPEVFLLAVEEISTLESCIRKLPQRMRWAVTLRRDQQLTFSEIGERLGCTGEAARKLWNRAVARLRRELQR